MTLIWIAFACLCAVTAFLLRAYRELRAHDARCAAAAAAAEAEAATLRALFPALVGLMRAFAPPQERPAIDVVAKAHAAVQRATTPQARLLAEARLADGVRDLALRARSVPQIRTLEEFSELEQAIDAAERRLVAARRHLSAATERYNRALDRFPVRRLAPRLRLAPRAFYDIALERGFVDEVSA